MFAPSMARLAGTSTRLHEKFCTWKEIPSIVQSACNDNAAVRQESSGVVISRTGKSGPKLAPRRCGWIKFLDNVTRCTGGNDPAGDEDSAVSQKVRRHALPSVA